MTRLLDLYDARDLLSFDSSEEFEYIRRLDRSADPEQAQLIFDSIDRERDLLDQLETHIERRRDQLDEREPEARDRLETLRHEHDHE